MEVVTILMFLMCVSIPVIAIFSELSGKTPSHLFYTIARSTICIGMLVFGSVLLSPLYVVAIKHFVIVSFVFIVSCSQLHFELNGIDTGEFIKSLLTKYTTHHID